jgi:hypothetical protein
MAARAARAPYSGRTRRIGRRERFYHDPPRARQKVPARAVACAAYHQRHDRLRQRCGSEGWCETQRSRLFLKCLGKKAASCRPRRCA